MQIDTFQDIDWNILWQTAKKSANRQKKTATDWDKKAPGFARRTRESIYIDRFLDLLQPEQRQTILDVGCGPGTLAIPLAHLGNRVTALDYSSKMIELLRQRAKAEQCDKVVSHTISWEDDWRAADIAPHDVVIASRSLAVHNLQAALEKMHAFAKEKICLTDRVGHGPLDPDAYAAVGRDLSPGPDYIYTINLLYSMGINAEVRLIPLEETMTFSSIAEAVQSYGWMFQNLTAQEEKQLADYVTSLIIDSCADQVTIRRQHIPTWAFISWQKIHSP